MDRVMEGTLRLRKAMSGGVLSSREKWVKVRSLAPIIGTQFPDIERILLADKQAMVPAEVKFTTSLFNYHRETNPQRFNDFLLQGGCLVVLRHDYLPVGLSGRPIDVYEVELSDFVSYCRENFLRLLNRQIKAHTETKVWMMYQGPNFNESSQSAGSARMSRVWCPTENLTGFDLALGDRVLFVRTRGSNQPRVQSQYPRGTLDNTWRLVEIYIAEVTSTIYSREEYCQIKRLNYQTTELWSRDELRGVRWRFDRVFEFRRAQSIELDMPIAELLTHTKLKPFVDTLFKVFCQQRSHELQKTVYQDLLEHLASLR
jgi:hypothetical protein